MKRFVMIEQPVREGCFRSFLDPLIDQCRNFATQIGCMVSVARARSSAKMFVKLLSSNRAVEQNAISTWPYAPVSRTG